MEMMPVTLERKAQLETYAKEHGQSPAEALDDLLASQLDAEQREYKKTVQGVPQPQSPRHSSPTPDPPHQVSRIHQDWRPQPS